MRTLRLLLAVLAVLAVVSCGSDDDGSSSSTAQTGGTTPSTDPPDGGDDAEAAAFCEAYTAFTADIEVDPSTGEISPGDSTALLDATPEELRDDVDTALEEFGTAEPSESGIAASEAIGAYLTEHGCDLGSDAPGGGTPTFTYESFTQSGDTTTFVVTGSCGGGTFPTDVTSVSGFGDELTWEDLGDGRYATDFDLADSADLDQPAVLDQVLAELGIPATADAPESTMTGVCE